MIVILFNQLNWIVLNEHKDEFLEKPKTFVCISSLMTWAKTKIDSVPELYLYLVCHLILSLIGGR